MSSNPSEGKKIANLLLNLPVKDRDWLLKNIAPETFGRWARRHFLRNGKQKDFAAQMTQFRLGEEQLSDLAKYERENIRET